MEKSKKGCCSNLKTKLLSVSVILCIIFAGISIFLGIRLLTSPSRDPTDRYPFFPHSATDEKRIRSIVDEINAKNLPWKAKYNAHASLEKGSPENNEYDEGQFHSLKLEGHDLWTSIDMQALGDTEAQLRKLDASSIVPSESFDARVQWPRCASIHNILNQGGCGSCWAAASVSVLSDRLCISTDGRTQQLISLQDLVSCCDFCGGCSGAYPMLPFIYWTKTGIVTGGSLGSNEGCRPYEVESTCGTPCPEYFCTAKFTPQCNKTCNNLYDREYESDLRKGKSFYWIKIEPIYEDILITKQTYAKISQIHQELSTSSNDLIKKEIMTNGPVVLCTTVHEPFAHYSSGIFTDDFDAKENFLYGHCMRIIGWGKEDGHGFWTIANSWGRQWGENGFGRLSMSYHQEELSVLAGLW